MAGFQSQSHRHQLLKYQLIVVDEIVDIRYFDRETQKSVEKIKEIDILPMYKFVLPDEPPKNFPPELRDKFTEERYFEGVELYQSYFNSDLESVLDYLGEPMVVGKRYNSIFGLSRKNYQKRTTMWTGSHD